MIFDFDPTESIRFLMSCGYTRQQAEEIVYPSDPTESWGF